MKLLPELLDCIISKCLLEGVEEVVADEGGEAAGTEVGDDGRQARAHREVASATDELAGKSAEAGPHIEGAVGVVQLHREKQGKEGDSEEAATSKN